MFDIIPPFLFKIKSHPECMTIFKLNKRKDRYLYDVTKSVLKTPYYIPIYTKYYLDNIYTYYNYFSRFYRALHTINFVCTLKRGVQ